MIVGIDFDNTIVSYEGVFYKVACDLDLIPDSCGSTKNQVRDYLRKIGREEQWTELQGIVYGARMQEAKPFPGVKDFFSRMLEKKIPLFIISHKTEFAKKGVRHNLHQSALNWLENNGFFSKADIGIDPAHVFFNPTRMQKIETIIACGCTHFIDDLPEMFDENAFPLEVEKILFDKDNHFPDSGITRFDNWANISKYFNV